ncbi:MAG: hypothetical protein M9915_13675 [Rhizobacter sp.]|nr:hypothetical protein [Rhizobacter sp.]
MQGAPAALQRANACAIDGLHSASMSLRVHSQGRAHCREQSFTSQGKIMATRKTTKKSELAQAGAHLSSAAKEVGDAVTQKIEALGDAMSSGMSRARKKVEKQGEDAKREVGRLVKIAEAQVKKARAQLTKATASAQKSVLAAEKKLEATKRSTGKKLAALQTGAERKAKALQKAIEKEAAAMKKGARTKAKAAAPKKAGAKKAPAAKKATPKAPAAKKSAKPVARKPAKKAAKKSAS